MEDVPKPFFEHLEELRFRLIKSVLAVAVGTAIGFRCAERVIRFLARPVGQFIFLQPTEAFFVQLKIALATGVLIAMPVILYQAWKFIFIALTASEQNSLFWVLPVSYLLFVLGCAFGFFVLVPAGIRFLLSYASDILVARLSIESYINFVGTICLVLGATFQMPLIAFFAARFGLMQPDWLAGKRRIAILVIYITSALVTPGPDPVTALLLAVPTYILFECSILAARWAHRSS